MDPLHITEFASERYFAKLKQLNENNENSSSSSSSSLSALPTLVVASTPRSNSAYTLPLGNPRPLDGYTSLAPPKTRDKKRRSLGHELTTLRTTRRPAFSGSFGSLRSQVTVAQKYPSITEYREQVVDIATRENLDNSNIGHLLLALPNELQVYIIAPLLIDSILNLRLVSRSFHALITENETPIALFHIERNLPAYTLRLYPVPQPPNINLNYFCGVWHRLHVAQKLSATISSQAVEEIFLRTTEALRIEFEPQHHRMRQRLTPRIFTLIHFFESYRELHLKHLMENGIPLRFQPFTLNPIEASILSLYDDASLLAVHEAFPLIMSSFSRCLRPPSYLGRLERSTKGYLHERPADEIYTTILTIGGLRQALRFWEMTEYNVRRAAVDEWYGYITRSPSRTETLPKSKISLLKRLGRNSSTSDAERKPNEATGCSVWYCVKDNCRAHQYLQSFPGVIHSSLTAGPPMTPLIQNQLQVLLPDLPRLEDLWTKTAETLILERKIVGRPQDIKRTHRVLLDLIKDGTDDVFGSAVERTHHPVQAASLGIQNDANPSVAVDNGSREPEVTSNVESNASNLPTVPSAVDPVSPRQSLESITESVATLFWANDDLKGLFCKTSVTPRNVTLDWCEESFMRSWIHACERLGHNNLDSGTRANTRALRRLSRHVAHSVRAKVASQNVKGVEQYVHISTGKSASSNSSGDITRNSVDSISIYNWNRQANLECQDPDMDDEELQVDAAQLMTFISTSGLYQTILDIFRLSIHTDMVEETILEVWPIGHPRSSASTVEFDLHWEIPTYLKTHFSLIQQLGDVLTITGDCGATGEAFNAQAISCGNYLSVTWPDIASGLLEGIGSMLHTSQAVFIQRENFEFELQQKATSSQGSLESSAYMKITARYELQQQFSYALSWLTAAIRHSKHEGLTFSHTIPRLHGRGVVSLTPEKLQPVSETISCWPSLFQNAVVAHGYPISARSEGKGLEISFVDMTNLARSLAFVEVEGGLVLDGLLTVLFPVRQLRKDNAIQWHLELKPEKSEDDACSLGTHPSKVMASCIRQSWHKVLNADQLATTRVFLGWAEKAHIVLGTESSFPLNVEVSGAFDNNPTRPLKTFGGSAGVSLLGFANFSATASTTRSAVSSGISGIKNAELGAMKQNLKNGVEKHVIIYDDDQDTGWLISYTTLVLFLAQIYLLRQVNPQSTLPVGLYAPAAYDGGESARRTINKFTATASKNFLDSNDENLHCGDVSNPELSPGSLTELIKVTWHRLILIQDELRKVYTDARKTSEVAPELILGVELMDVALREEAMPVKRARVDNAWAHLAEHQPCMVLFCKNLGQATVPSSTTGLCAEWSLVPAGKKLLVATGPSVVHILKKRTRKGVSRLGDHISWSFKSQIIELHQPGLRTRCSHVQYLRSEVPSDDQSGVLDAVKAYENGGYIFGSLFPLKKEIKRMAVTSNDPTLKKPSTESHNSNNTTIPTRFKAEPYQQTLLERPMIQPRIPKRQEYLPRGLEGGIEMSSIDDNLTFPNGDDNSTHQNNRHRLTQNVTNRCIGSSENRLRRVKGKEQLVCDSEVHPDYSTGVTLT